MEAFLGKVQEAKGKERAIGEEKFTEEKLKQEKVSLEQALLENKEAQEGLKGVEAEKRAAAKTGLRKPWEKGRN